MHNHRGVSLKSYGLLDMRLFQDKASLFFIHSARLRYYNMHSDDASYLKIESVQFKGPHTKEVFEDTWSMLMNGSWVRNNIGWARRIDWCFIDRHQDRIQGVFVIEGDAKQAPMCNIQAARGNDKLSLCCPNVVPNKHGRVITITNSTSHCYLVRFIDIIVPSHVWACVVFPSLSLVAFDLIAISS